ncbi:Bikaverin cluster transcription factor bik5 [Lasiodiplodia hormozganensis]|uniref:Bikaverin cluster transcription factor bik5 n=1 Tax=Lasiodiplodia hormozganensis TaxID=869390 RepID=A0AA39Y869_9PEZI|nr:Bikaverin cluster transcription factor bik5 [Lasiodiplodia hormozganensis]
MANRVWAITESFGTLEVRQEGTKYTTNGSLAIIHDEAEELKTVRVEKEEAHAECVSRKKEIPTFFESIWSQGVPHEGLRLYLPPATKIRFYLDTYTERVDPCIKVLHLPTDSAFFLAYEDVSARTAKAPSSLVFAMCYSATAALSAEECERELGEDKRTLLLRYKLASQHSLRNEGLLRTRSISVLQAFVILLSSMPGNESEDMWPLSGMAVRIAQQMGVHRDGSHFALSPFTIEMRRRLWWQICYFDLIISERCGQECTTIDMKFDTNFPLNIRDSDLSPTMQHPPQPCSEYTEVTCGLIYFESVRLLRRMKAGNGGPAEKERYIEEFANNITNTYLHPRNNTHCLFPVGTATFRFMLSKLWLFLYRPFRSFRRGLELPKATVDRLFVGCLECLEAWRTITADSRIARRSVLFRLPRLWHQLCYVLLQLCEGRNDELAKRAWETVADVSLPPPDSFPDSTTALLLRPVHRLMAHAREMRTGAAPSEQAGKNLRSQEQTSCPADNEVTAERQNMDITPDFNFGDGTTPWLEWQAIWDELDRETMWGEA